MLVTYICDGAQLRPEEESDNLQRALTVLTLIDNGSQHDWDDDRDRHRHAKHLPVARLDGKNAPASRRRRSRSP